MKKGTNSIDEHVVVELSNIIGKGLKPYSLVIYARPKLTISNEK